MIEFLAAHLRATMVVASVSIEHPEWSEATRRSLVEWLRGRILEGLA